MASSQAKLTLRAPPHRQFIQGWPGIPEGQGRPAAHIAGSVEVRLGTKGLRASWLRIELRKLEMTPSGENWGELIGRGPMEVWKAQGLEGTDGEGKWDLLQTADYPFKIYIPEGLPPTARLDKQIGISYEMVTSLCVKSKKGLLRKEETSTVIQSTQAIVIEKHELHSTWPIYAVPDDHELMANQVVARVYRKQTCYGPGDKVELRIILTSKNVSPVKIKAVAVSIRETVTFKGNSKRSSRVLSGGATKTANQRTESIAQKAQNLGIKLYKGDTKTYDMSLTIPKNHSLMTIQTAKHIEISYTMRIYVDAKQPIILDHLPLTITSVPRAQSSSTVPAIGFVPGLSAPLGSPESQRYSESVRSPAPANGLSRTQSQTATAPRPTPARVAPAPAPTPTAPMPSRNMSFRSTSSPSETSTIRGNTNLGRRDTMMTTGSGPGLAGRGVPGQVFGWGYGGQPEGGPIMTSAFGSAAQGPRLHFGGPGSIYEGRELAPEENRALFHSSFATPLGQVFEGSEPIPGVHHEYQNELSRRPTVSQQNSYQSQRSLDSVTEGVQSTTMTSQTNAHDAAEAEKERLYRRARKQAERNQRRAAEAAATTSATKPSSPPQSRSAGASQAAKNEKLALYERARREAERYQAGYSQGASFPREDLEPDRSEERHSRRNSVSDSVYDGIGSSAFHSTPSSSASHGQVVGGSSAGAARDSQQQPHNGYPTAEQEKRRLYEAAQAERDSYLATGTESSAGPRSNGSHSDQGRGNRSSKPASREKHYPSAEEEKKRFAAAQAERDDFLRTTGRGQGQGSSSSSGARQSRNSTGATGSSNKASGATPPNAQRQSYPTAEDEKRMLYERAKAEVETGLEGAQQGSRRKEQRHSGGSGVENSRGAPRSSYPSAEDEKRRIYERAQAEVAAATGSHAKTSPSRSAGGDGDGSAGNAGRGRSSSSSRQNATGPSVSTRADDEKAQMKRYYEAQDAVARYHGSSNGDGAGNSSRHVSGSSISSAGPPALARPSPSYATGYRSSMAAAAASTDEASEAAPSASRRRPSDATTDDSASVFSIPFRSASTVAGKQRSAPSPSTSPPPGLPAFSFSSLGTALPPKGEAGAGQASENSGHLGVHGVHPTNHSDFAPSIASANWDEDDDDDDDQECREKSSNGARRGSGGGGGGGGGKKQSSKERAPAPPRPPKTPLTGGGGSRSFR